MFNVIASAEERFSSGLQDLPKYKTKRGNTGRKTLLKEGKLSRAMKTKCAHQSQTLEYRIE